MARAASGAVDFQVRVAPGAQRSEIVGRYGARLKLRVDAQPERGRANEAVRRLLAETLNIRLDQVEIVSGTSAKDKRVRVRGIDPARIDELGAAAMTPSEPDTAGARSRRGRAGRAARH